MNPILVDAFAAAGGFWLASVGEDLTPPVSFMGGKRRLARELLALFDLRPGCGLPLLLNDGSWWGWVWPVVLDPDTGPRVSAILRSWRGEDPRALWFRLRDMGPITDDAAGAAAQLLWLQARAASGVPVWWEGSEAVSDMGWKSATCASRVTSRAKQTHAHEPTPRRVRLAAGSEGSEGSRSAQAKGVHGGPGRVVQHASTQIDEAGQRQVAEPRLLATTRGNGQPPGAPYEAGQKFTLLSSDGRGTLRESGHKGRDSRAGGGIVDPDTIAHRIDAIRTRLLKGSGGEAAPGKQDGWCAANGWRVLQTHDVADRIDRIRNRTSGVVAIENLDALDFARKWAPVLRERALVYLDPPYAGATGYALACPRAKVLDIAGVWQRHGARVVLSEAVGLASELGDGWEQVELRRGKKHEWATIYGCDATAVLPPILRAASRPGSAA